MKTVADFYVFGQRESGQVVTHQGDNIVVYARNPYGSHNLIICQKSGWHVVGDYGHRVDDYDAFRLGDAAVFDYVNCWFPMKKVKRVLNFLIKRGKNPV